MQVLLAVLSLVVNLAVISPPSIVGVAVVYLLTEVLLCTGYSLGIYNWWTNTWQETSAT